MKASGSLIFEWLALALGALMTGALSIFSLLLMLGGHNYAVVILFRDKKVTQCVTCECKMSAMNFFDDPHSSKILSGLQLSETS